MTKLKTLKDIDSNCMNCNDLHKARQEAIKWAKHWELEFTKHNLWLHFFNITKADLTAKEDLK